MVRDALGERLGHVAQRPGIGEHAVPAVQFELRRQRERPDGLHFHRLVGATASGQLPRLLERVEIAGQQVPGGAGGGADALRQAIPRRGGVDRDVDQQGSRSADHVGADAPRGQFDEVRQGR